MSVGSDCGWEYSHIATVTDSPESEREREQGSAGEVYREMYIQLGPQNIQTTKSITNLNIAYISKPNLSESSSGREQIF